MLNSWFGSKSGRRSQPPQTPPTLYNDQSAKSVTSSLTPSTVGRVQRTGGLTRASGSEAPPDGVQSHTDDPPTPSLIHTAEKEIATVRTSVVPSTSPDALPDQRDSSRVTDGDGTLFTPQDAIVAQVFGRSVPPATANPVQTTPPPPSTSGPLPPQPSVSLTVSDSLPPQTPPASSAHPGPTLTIYDPFSGAKLGERSPISPSMNKSAPGEASSTQPEALPTADDRKLWSSLERILELQAEIAAMHAEMEGVGGRGVGGVHAGGIAGVGAGEGGRAGHRKRSRRGLTLPVGDEEPEEHGPESGHPGGAFSEISTDHSDEDDEDDTFGNGKRRRDEEFARLAEQFAQRKTVIGGIMDKLDDLSMALKTFHALPPPLFDLATSPSRRDTISSLPSNASGASSPPPFRVYHDQSSSPFSSVSPSRTGMPVTPPSAPLSPPVPPISIPAPTASPGSPGFLPEPVIAPVLPRTALPTIIPGAPHVESPADMHPTQSIFQEAP